jgi:AbrB family looped-hinge helix DNA binding protein
MVQMTVVVTAKNDLVVPKSVRRKAGIKNGDAVEFKVCGRVIHVLPKAPSGDDEYTPAERRVIDRGISASEKDYTAGRAFGPFKTHADFIASLHEEAAKLRPKRKTKRPAK